MLLNCGVREDSWESLGLQGDQTSPSQRKSVLNIHWKDWCWSWNYNCWSPDVKNWLIRKDPDAGKDGGQEEKGRQRTRWLDGITDSMDEFEQALGVSDGQGGLECCSPRGRKELDMTERLNWTELNIASWTQKCSHIFHGFLSISKSDSQET